VSGITLNSDRTDTGRNVIRCLRSNSTMVFSMPLDADEALEYMRQTQWLTPSLS
jgi:hypothetical protein